MHIEACETAKDADNAQKFINRMLSMEKVGLGYLLRLGFRV